MSGFTLSRALFIKKCGALQLGRQTLFFLKKTIHLLVITLLFTRGSPIFFGVQKIPLLLWGPLFVGAPVRPNMLDMPKSAAGPRPQFDQVTGTVEIEKRGMK